MDPYQSGQVEMFVNITGASEADARDKLRAFKGDLNAAIDSYLSEKENFGRPVQVEEANLPAWVDEAGPPPSQRITSTPFFRLPFAPAWRTGQRRVGGFGIEGALTPLSPLRGTSPIVSQPRDVREIPIDWRDGESRVQSNPGLLIEEIPATVEESPPSQRPAHFVTDAEEDAGPLPSASWNGNNGRPRFGGNYTARNSPARHTNLNAPSSIETRTMARDDSDDVEEDILRAVIEASERETKGIHISESSSNAGQLEAEDDDFARAVSLSLKTAEQEKALRKGEKFSWLPESGVDEDGLKIDNHEKLDSLKGGLRRDSSSARIKSSIPSADQASTAPADIIYSELRDYTGNGNDLEEEPLLRRRPGSFLNSAVTSSDTANSVTSQQLHKEPSSRSGKAKDASDTNGQGTGNNEWAGLSSEEQEEAVLLEAALFGSLPENIASRFGYPSVTDGNMDGRAGNLLDNGTFHSNGRPVQQPPSRTVVAERLLREQQDDEYLASLIADQEKEERARLEERARHLKEAEAKADVHAKEKLQQDEDLRKCLAEEESLKQVAVKQAALPEEPPINDDSAVTLMVRMPDGTRQSRRFHKSESLQCLRDFIDVSCGPLPNSYRLVRPYPRKAFLDAEYRSSFYELGLNSKYETLFLELV